MKEKTPVAVLGATGMVGQQLLTMLERHPWFALSEVVASDRNAGKSYGDVVRWVMDSPLPPQAGSLLLKGPDDPLGSPLVFSCLTASVARELEPRLAKAGHLVVSNASAFRREPDVPLLIPEVNPDSLRLLAAQHDAGLRGGLVTNPNCVVAGLALGIAPMHRMFKVTRAVVVTLQGLSGAGVPGHPAVEMIDNVIPWIEGEEEKICYEMGRILGAQFVMSASVHRVPVLHGHMMSVCAETEMPVPREEMIRAWESFRPPDMVLGLPSCPRHPIVYRHEANRPQPRMDRMTGGGMTVTIGRARACPALGLAFELCVHNLIRGAAGAALLNGELCLKLDLVR